MLKDWLIAGPILGYCVFVIVRKIRGKGKNGCSRHSVYGIPDEEISAGCSACPLQDKCGKKQKDPSGL